MKASTVEVLDRINRDFYRERASEFSRTRKRPWTGWRKLFGLADSSLRSPRVSILDLGCGNGRLLPELVRAFGTEISYLGLDRSVPLVGEARRTLEGSLTARAHLAAADLLREPLAELALHARFDLILAFGLLRAPPGDFGRVGFWGFRSGSSASCSAFEAGLSPGTPNPLARVWIPATSSPAIISSAGATPAPCATAITPGLPRPQSWSARSVCERSRASLRTVSRAASTSITCCAGPLRKSAGRTHVEVRASRLSAMRGPPASSSCLKNTKHSLQPCSPMVSSQARRALAE